MGGYRRRLRHDAFEYLEYLRDRGSNGMLRIPWGGWCVTDTAKAHSVLRDAEFNSGRSAFFSDMLPTREAQIEVGRAVRNLLRSQLPEYRVALAVEVSRLPAASQWPAAGIDLVYRSMRDILLHPESPGHLRDLMDRGVHGGIMFQAPTVRQRIRAEFLRTKFNQAFTEEVARRRKNPAEEPRDVLDALLATCSESLPDETVSALFGTMYRSSVAPSASTLAWSVLLAFMHHASDSPLPWPADWIVREAMRHRPMVWMVGRAVPHDTEINGVSFKAGEFVSTSPYLMHHAEQGWTDHDVFRPERWGEPERGPFIPFGAGPFICSSAAVAMELMTDALTVLTDGARVSVTGGDTRPVMIEGAVPRPFTLHRSVGQLHAAGRD
ncbi:cytochrome P450 [Kitasatospora brasiliensis]|uniref:cytochrome P450 n=1 Tax=Kitasatospora brasiliensis TaxID=3058040 RepID=UPI00292DE702|nr:cytochrome P450 [Kitasatospora sp. K002]